MPLKVNRLTRLADLLEGYSERPGVPAFSLDSWSETQLQRRGMLWWAEQVQCHTTACAVGLACLTETFKDDGLTWYLSGTTIVPKYRAAEEWKAVQSFFGLSKRQAIKLFDGDDYDGPIHGPDAAKAVAAEIRKLIAAPVAARPQVKKPKLTVVAA